MRGERSTRHDTLGHSPNETRRRRLNKEFAGALSNLGLVLLGGFGIVALVNPLFVVGRLGIAADGAAAVAQLRALLGAIPLALALLAISTRSPGALLAAALVPLAAAFTKGLSGIFENDARRQNLLAATADALLGGLIIAGYTQAAG